ncbi:MAG: AMP-binding protein [Candidatus Didemnitutus sp.]|nr:AMP-binding protein [Candidatus Didemnitutus sp.]
MERRELARLLETVPHDDAPRTLIATADREVFRAEFARAAAGRGEVFLGDPSWNAADRAEFAQLPHVPTENTKAQLGLGWLMIPTGGSSGRLKFARHDSFTIAAAVKGFTQHFGLARVNALGLLPLFHVSGFMAWMRCVITGGEFVPGSWKDIEAGRRPVLPERADGWVLSLVPTQLERLLREPATVEWLRGFRIVFLGGAPAWPDLLDRAAEARVPLSLSYGMTETAAMVAALRPEEFAHGARSSGAVLPHARVVLGEGGAICVSGRSLFRGYYPDWRHERKMFETADLGRLDAARHLHVLGRRDAVIISGGEKVQPLAVEAVLKSATGCARLAVIGMPDREWGERVVAVYAADAEFDLARVRATVQHELPAPQRPKEYLALAHWPLTEAGKLNRAQLRQLAEAQLRTGATRGSA